jgi:hypothetical protein
MMLGQITRIFIQKDEPSPQLSWPTQALDQMLRITAARRASKAWNFLYNLNGWDTKELDDKPLPWSLGV